MKLLIPLVFISLLLLSCKEEVADGHFDNHDTLVKSPEYNTPGRKMEHDPEVLNITLIDSAAFYTTKANVNPVKEKYSAITDRKLVNRMLKGVVNFADYDGDKLIASDSGVMVTSIKPRRGNIITFDKYNEPGFTAYYPELDILLCEAGHQLEVSYNLVTGEDEFYTGNPELFITSADKTMRLNGSYDGQECNLYFIQAKQNGQFRRIMNLYDVVKDRTPEGNMVCQIADAFWKDNTTLYIRENLMWPNRYYKVVLANNGL